MRKHFYIIIIIICLAVATAAIYAENNRIPAVVVSAKNKISSTNAVKTNLTDAHSQTSGSKTVLSSSEIKSAGEESLTQALQNLGNIQVQDTTGNGSQV